MVSDFGSSAVSRSRKGPSLESRIRMLSLSLIAPGLALAAVWAWPSGASRAVLASLMAGLLLYWAILTGLLLERVVRPLQTLSNVIASLRESDYSFRARGSRSSGALGELAVEINALADMLQSRRLEEMEAVALLRHVISSMDAPVLAFDAGQRLQLLNPAAESIFGLTRERALGRSADALHLTSLLHQPDRGVLILSGDANPTHWMVRRSGFRQRGMPHTLLVLSDVSTVLRERERDAWQRLIRVIGHEINNSLTPIKSIAGSLLSRSRSLRTKAPDSPPAMEYADDQERGLAIIEARAESLNRFVQAYRQLAQLPAPSLKPVSLRAVLERAAALETRVPVQLRPGSETVLQLDPDLMEQMTINLIRNAAEATLARTPQASVRGQEAIQIGWRVTASSVEISIEDRGVGLVNSANLFVPFYTTKAGGSGIGLALARQICEVHGGSLRLSNRAEGPGCVAEISLPRQPAMAGRSAAPAAEPLGGVAESSDPSSDPNSDLSPAPSPAAMRPGY